MLSAVIHILNSSQAESLSRGRSNYDNSLLSVIDLRELESFERKYFKKMLLNRVKLNIKNLDFLEILKMLIRYNVQLFLR
jgi:hypothetical protein